MAKPQYLLDSNVVIYILKGTAPKAAARLITLALGTVVTSSLCLAEMLIGLRDDEHVVLLRLLQQIEVVSFGADAAECYAALPFKRRGFDRLIAAHALVTGLTIVTANTADFADIPGLRVEDWTRP